MADALSRRAQGSNQNSREKSNCIKTHKFNPIKKSYEKDEMAEKMIQEFGGVDGEEGEWKLHNGVLKKQNRFYLCGQMSEAK